MTTEPEPQYTPGPWRIEHYNNGRLLIFPGTRTAEHAAHLFGSIAVVHAEFALPGTATRGIYEANARLISAAPDLLTALESLWTSATDDHDCPWCDDAVWYGKGHGCDMASMVEAAISMAREVPR